MFGKLLKHDFIATGRIMGIVYAIFAVLSAYLVGSVYLGDVSIEEMGFLEAMSVIILVFGSLINIVLTVVVIMMNFQKSLYGDQGYLTFTLPVSSFSVLASKLIVSTFWFILSFAAFLGSCFIVVDVGERSMGEEGLTLIDMLLGIYDTNLNMSVLIFIGVWMLVNAFFSALLFMVEVCFSITLSNTRHFQKHHVIFTLLFAAISIGAASKITSAIAENIIIGFTYNPVTDGLKLITDITEANISFVNMTASIISIIFIVGFFFATHYLMHKKVNIR